MAGGDMRRGSPMKASGFTLIELVIVIVLVGVLSAYAMMKNGSSSVFSLVSQAQTMASDIRHAQALATVWGKRLRITATDGANGVYEVSCDDSADVAPPCDTNPVINPATGRAFSVRLEKGVVLDGPPSPLIINSLGQPVDSFGQPTAASSAFTLSTQGNSLTLNVAALTGYVTVVNP